MPNIKQGKLPKPPVDPVQEALAALWQLPRGSARGAEHFKLIVEDALKHPRSAGLVEEAGRAWGLTPEDARELRAKIEGRVKPDMPAPGTVRVLVDVAEREREEWKLLNSPARRGEWDPFFKAAHVG